MENITNWTEGILLSVAFVLIFGLIVSNMNIIHHKNYNLGNLETKANQSEQSFVQYQSNAQTQISGGDVAFDAQNGISLKSSYGLITDGMNVIWTFLSGGWIEETINLIPLGEAGVIIGAFLRLLYIIGLISALLYALFKVVV